MCNLTDALPIRLSQFSLRFTPKVFLHVLNYRNTLPTSFTSYFSHILWELSELLFMHCYIFYFSSLFFKFLMILFLSYIHFILLACVFM